MANPGGAATRTPKQQSAYDMVKYARRKGESWAKMPEHCQEPGCSNPATETAHKDYHSPTDVRFLCASHNRLEGHSAHRGTRQPGESLKEARARGGVSRADQGTYKGK